MSEWTENLICAHVDCDAENDIIDILKDLSGQGRLDGWLLKPLDIPGAHPWCLEKGNVKVALCQTRRNIAMTSNVLPVDELQDADKSNAYTKSLHTVFNMTGGIVNSNIG